MDTRTSELPGLEHSCGLDGPDWVRVAPGRAGAGPDRIEARFGGHAYEPHRHDTYAIGLTLSGVQSFGYRGETRHSLAGDAIVLHPDEVHDGHAGSEDGFRYRMLYVDPETVRAAMDDARRALPFVPDGVTGDPRLAAALAPAFRDLGHELEPLEWTSIAADIATALTDIDRGRRTRAPGAVDRGAVMRAKQAMLDTLDDGIDLDALETVTGLSRFALARHFRAVCGVSPHRWRVMRRIDRARTAIEAGSSLADAAMVAGFADQSHMTRHFKSAIGMSPGSWRRYVGIGRSEA